VLPFYQYTHKQIQGKVDDSKNIQWAQGFQRIFKDFKDLFRDQVYDDFAIFKQQLSSITCGAKILTIFPP